MYPEHSDPDSPPPPEKWRNEVASRVDHYRVRRRRKVEGNYSMRLDFSTRAESAVALQEFEAHVLAAEQPRPREICDTNYYRRANAEALGIASASIPVASAAATAPAMLPEVQEPLPESAVVREPEPLPQERVEEFHEPPKPVLPQTNVIVFPRPVMEPPLAPTPQRDELAEPMFDRPRILDVPEGIVPTIDGPLFANVHLEPEEPENTPETASEFNFDLPLQVAMLPQRAAAAVTDWAIVFAGTAAFAVAGARVLSVLPHTKPFLAAAILLPVIFWSIYQYLFLVYAGQTIGMKTNRLRLSRFDGARPTWRDRKRRAGFMILSCISVGFGFLWAMVDEDSLCWHDRITRTFVTQDE